MTLPAYLCYIKKDKLNELEDLVMKTYGKRFYYMLLIVCISAIALSSCHGLDVYWSNGDYYENSEHLCSRTWTDSWYDSYDGVSYYQELRFYGDGTGTDYLESVDYYGNRRSSSLRFIWDWTSYNSIVLDYGNSRSYMDEIHWNGWDKMSCLFDGERVYFSAY